MWARHPAWSLFAERGEWEPPVRAIYPTWVRAIYPTWSVLAEGGERGCRQPPVRASYPAWSLLAEGGEREPLRLPVDLGSRAAQRHSGPEAVAARRVDSRERPAGPFAARRWDSRPFQ